MSGKYMRTRKVVISTLTMVLIASQLMGCGAVSQSELLTMLNNGQEIEITVAEPISTESGTGDYISNDWISLDQKESVSKLRKALDDVFNITVFGDSSKNGIFYVDLDKQQCGNNTLYNVFINSKFRNDYWNNESIRLKTAQTASDYYKDITITEQSDTPDIDEAVLASLNGYFDLIDDRDGYANMDRTLTRLEVMSAIYKADTPVTDIDTLSNKDDVKEFINAIGTTADNEMAVLAAGVQDQSYLTIQNDNLDSTTANGTITRGELVYILVNRYYADEYKNVDINSPTYNDIKNGGDIASKQEFAGKDNGETYELVYCLNNADNGGASEIPEKMYKCFIVAYNNGIINEDNSKWNEGVTKADFLELLTNTYKSLPVGVSAERGQGEEILTAEEQYEKQIEETLNNIDEQQQNREGETFTVDGMDEVMYVTEDCNVYKGPQSLGYETVAGELKQGDKVQVIGHVVEDDEWYLVSIGLSEMVCVHGEYLTSENPNAESEVVQQPQSQPETSQPEQQPTQPEQQPSSSEVAQQPTTEQQPESSSTYDWNPDNVINPETGQPVQPGDEYWLDEGHHTKVTIAGDMTADEWLKSQGY